jgi:hypothetical protein
MTAGQLNSKLKFFIWLFEGLFVAGIFFSGHQILTRGNNFNDNKAKLQQAENRLNYLLETKKEYQKSRLYEAEITDALPKEEEVSQFLYTVSALGKQYGVTVKRLDFPPVKTAKGAPLSFKSNLELSSNNINSLEELIIEIENNNRIIDIASLTIKKIDNEYLAIMSITGYYKK